MAMVTMVVLTVLALPLAVLAARVGRRRWVRRRALARGRAKAGKPLAGLEISGPSMVACDEADRGAGPGRVVPALGDAGRAERAAPHPVLTTGAAILVITSP
jgi:hypothetical protein